MGYPQRMRPINRCYSVLYLFNGFLRIYVHWHVFLHVYNSVYNIWTLLPSLLLEIKIKKFQRSKTI